MIKEFGIDHTDQAAESHCFYAKVDGPKGKPHYDERESKADAKPVWLSAEEVKKIFEKQLPGFSKHRFRMIFQRLGLLVDD